MRVSPVETLKMLLQSAFHCLKAEHEVHPGGTREHGIFSLGLRGIGAAYTVKRLASNRKRVTRKPA